MKRWQWLLLIGGAVLVLAGGGIVAGVASIPVIVNVAKNAGFGGVDLVTAVAVALAESGGKVDALGDVNVPHAGAASYGLWQINSYWHPEYGPDFTLLYDPQTNANAAFAIYLAAGRSFSPWSTFKSGAYARFVDTISEVMNA